MKTAKIIFIIISIGLALFLAYSIINTGVSLKYEIDERSIWVDTISIDWGRQYLLGLINTLHIFFFYVAITIVFLTICLIKDKRKGKNKEEDNGEKKINNN